MVIFQVLRRVLNFNKMRKAMANSTIHVLFWAAGLNVLFGVMFYFAERSVQDISLVDALWWSMVTMTTVGYGDFYAQTHVGRFLISYPCMILGIGIIGYLVGVVANTIIDLASKKRRGLMDIPFSNHIIICNYPGDEKVLAIISELRAVKTYAKKKMVVITDRFEEIPEALHEHDISFVYGAATDESVLLRANIFEADGVIILAEDNVDARSDERTFMITSLIELIEREHDCSIKTIAEVVSGKNVLNFKRVRVDGVTSHDGVASCLLVQEYLNPGINAVIGQLISNQKGSELYMCDVNAAGLRIRDLQFAALNHEENIQVLGLRREGNDLLNPSKECCVQKGDTLIVLADNHESVRVLENEIVQMSKPQYSQKKEESCSTVQS